MNKPVTRLVYLAILFIQTDAQSSIPFPDPGPKASSTYRLPLATPVHAVPGTTPGQASGSSKTSNGNDNGNGGSQSQTSISSGAIAAIAVSNVALILLLVGILTLLILRRRRHQQQEVGHEDEYKLPMKRAELDSDSSAASSPRKDGPQLLDEESAVPRLEMYGSEAVVEVSAATGRVELEGDMEFEKAVPCVPANSVDNSAIERSVEINFDELLKRC